MNSKIFSKITAAILALMLIASLTVTSFAIGSADTGTIRVTGVEDGVATAAYQIITVNYDYDADQPVDPVYAWASGVATWVKSNYSDYYNDIEKFNDALTAEEKAAFYDALAAAIKDGTVTLTAAATGSGTADLTDLAMGNYLVLVENGMKVYRPSAVNLVPKFNTESNKWEMTTPAAITVKASEPTITKSVDDTQAAIGDTVNYTVVSDIPQYPTGAKHTTYKVSDNPTGLDITIDSVKVYGTVGATDTEITGTNAYTPTVSAASLALVFDYSKINKYEKIKVTYSATVNAAAVVTDGNPNTAKLVYTNNPYTETDSTKEKTSKQTVYTYGLDLRKVDKSNNTLYGAEFTLAKGGSNIKFIKIMNGVYRVALTDEANTTEKLVAASGTLKVTGLDVGEYALAETKAPNGYNKPSSAITLTLTDADKDGVLDDDGEADGYLNKDIVNSKGFVLPITGGTGTVLFTAIGVALILAGGILFIISRKKRTA